VNPEPSSPTSTRRDLDLRYESLPPIAAVAALHSGNLHDASVSDLLPFRDMSDDVLDRGRRRFIGTLLATPTALAAALNFRAPELLAGTVARSAAPSRAKPGRPASRFTPTPECGDDDEPTPPETEGPFFRPRSPLRTSLLEPGIMGTRIVLTGHVFSRGCRPLPGVLVDFWHASDDGEYDNEGFKLRGHQFTDATGRYRLETIVPGLYPGRTRHFHVKLQAPHRQILTTQLYFPGESRNRRDGLFRSDLLMAVKDGGAGKQARFHFMLDVA
jgi:protocatechuate 3,4-dioxygenase beta subunit